MAWNGFDFEKAYRPSAQNDKRVEDRQKERWAAQEFVRDLLKEKATWLMEGETPPIDGPKIVEILLKDIEGQPGNEMRRLARNFLIKGIAKGCQEKKWSLQIPQQTLRAKLPKPPITSNTFVEIGCVTILRDAFIDSFKVTACVKKQDLRISADSNSKMGINLHVGRTLLAAILFGGVANKKDLKAIATSDASSLSCFKEVVWLEWIQEKDQSGDPDLWRRWYPEEVAGLLIATAHRDGLFPLIGEAAANGADDEKALWVQIRAVLKGLNLDKVNLPKSLAQLITWTRTWLNYKVPPILAHFASGAFCCASLPPATHIRVITGQAQSIDLLSESKAEALNRSPILRGDVELASRLATTEERAVLQRDLRAIFTVKKPKKAVLREIEEYLQRTDLCPSFVRLAQWASYMVTRKQDGSGKLKNSSILSYIVRVDKRLSIILEDRDPAFFDEYTLEEVYSELIGGLPKSSVSRVIVALRKFHGFLADEFGVPDEIGDVFDGHASGSAIDANVLSMSDYRSAFKRLGPSHTGQPSWLSKMQQVALMLGYRMLLRRGEVHRLRIGDLLGNSSGVVYVRHTAAGDVKTQSGIRNIMFSGNLTEDEESTLREFISDRFWQISGASGPDTITDIDQELMSKVWKRPLFEEPGTAKIIPVFALFKEISKVLREVTGDKLSHYHLARKGGINWKLMSLMEAELPGCSLFLDPTGEAQKASRHLNLSLIKVGGADRRKVWAICTLAGHANPSTTVGSYISCLDWLLRYSLRRVEPLKDSFISEVTGISEVAIRSKRFRKQIPRENFLNLLEDDWLIKVKIEPLLESSTQQAATELLSEVPLNLPMQGYDALRILNEVNAGKSKIEQISNENGVLQSTIELWSEYVMKLENANSSICINLKSGIPLPKLPTDFSERKQLNFVTEALHKYASKKPELILDWLIQFWNAYVARENTVMFHDVHIATPFYETLKSFLPQNASSLGFSLAPLIKMNAPRAESQVAIWLDALKIPASEMTNDPGIIRQPGNSVSGRLSIFLKYKNNSSENKDDCSDKLNSNNKTWTKTRSGALAGAAYIMTIWLLSRLHPAAP
jgi:hypothetical protein